MLTSLVGMMKLERIHLMVVKQFRHIQQIELQPILTVAFMEEGSDPVIGKRQDQDQIRFWLLGKLNVKPATRILDRLVHLAKTGDSVLVLCVPDSNDATYEIHRLQATSVL